MWPFRRGRQDEAGPSGPDEAGGDAGEVHRAPRRDWAQLPPVARTLHPSPTTIQREFASSLATHTSPQFLAPLSHQVRADGPSGLVRAVPHHHTAVDRPVQREPLDVVHAEPSPADPSRQPGTAGAWSLPSPAEPGPAPITVARPAPDPVGGLASAAGTTLPAVQRHLDVVTPPAPAVHDGPVPAGGVAADRTGAAPVEPDVAPPDLPTSSTPLVGSPPGTGPIGGVEATEVQRATTPEPDHGPPALPVVQRRPDRPVGLGEPLVGARDLSAGTPATASSVSLPPPPAPVSRIPDRPGPVGPPSTGPDAQPALPSSGPGAGTVPPPAIVVARTASMDAAVANALGSAAPPGVPGPAANPAAGDPAAATLPAEPGPGPGDAVDQPTLGAPLAPGAALPAPGRQHDGGGPAPLDEPGDADPLVVARRADTDVDAGVPASWPSSSAPAHPDAPLVSTSPLTATAPLAGSPPEGRLLDGPGPTAPPSVPLTLSRSVDQRAVPPPSTTATPTVSRLPSGPAGSGPSPSPAPGPATARSAPLAGGAGPIGTLATARLPSPPAGQPSASGDLSVSLLPAAGWDGPPVASGSVSSHATAAGDASASAASAAAAPASATLTVAQRSPSAMAPSSHSAMSPGAAWPGAMSPGAVALASGLGHAGADGSIELGAPGPHASGFDVSVQRAVQIDELQVPAGGRDGAPAPEGGATDAGASPAGGAGGQNLDELARDLWPRLRPRLRRELSLDRERAGRATDIRR